MKRNNMAKKLCASLLALAGLALLVVPAAQAAAPSQANSRYVIKGGEVYDTETDLTWQRCSVGLRLVEGRGCAGTAKKQLTFDEAQQQANGTWRVPNKDELASLIDKSKSPTIDREAFPDMYEGRLYWSSTSDGASDGWLVDFSIGVVGYGSTRTGTLSVRLVRSGQ